MGRSKEEVGRSKEEVGRSQEEVARSKEEVARSKEAVGGEQRVGGGSEEVRSEQGQSTAGGTVGRPATFTPRHLQDQRAITVKMEIKR